MASLSGDKIFRGYGAASKVGEGVADKALSVQERAEAIPLYTSLGLSNNQTFNPL